MQVYIGDAEDVLSCRLPDACSPADDDVAERDGGEDDGDVGASVWDVQMQNGTGETVEAGADGRDHPRVDGEREQEPLC